MTCVLLDTNTYLRLAKRIQPLLGVPFGQKGYVLTILKDVEDEVRRNPVLCFKFPWFNEQTLAAERLAKRVRLSTAESAQIRSMTSVLRAHVLENVSAYTSKGRSPPSPTDCYCLAFGQVRSAIVATDDLGMHRLAGEFDLPVWHGHEVLRKMLTAKTIDRALVIEIYTALENNNDLPASWRDVKHTAFRKIFGPAPDQQMQHGPEPGPG